MTKDDLKRCPFCGSEAEFVYSDEDDGTGHIECVSCRVRTPREWRGDAEQIWNRRNAYFDPNYPYRG